VTAVVHGFHDGAIWCPSPADGEPMRTVAWSWPEPTLRSRYVHFTTEEGRRAVVAERRLRAEPHEFFYGRGPFAVPEGGWFHPDRQWCLGRAACAVLLVADVLPSWCSPFEACWPGTEVALRHAEAVGYQEAAGLLDGSLRQVLRLPDGSLYGALVPAGYRPLPASPLAATIPDVRGLLAELTRHGDGFAACCSPLHGTGHWRAVAATGLRLALQTSGANPALVFAFAMLHDAFRQGDGADPAHGRRAAEALDGLERGDWLRLDGRQRSILFEALADHPHGRTTAEPTIGCCWDADRLDLGRCGIKVDVELLSTEAGRRSNICSTVQAPSWRELWAARSDPARRPQGAS
jgi:uncharacterized protein